jgi:large subunit ribosomal protein L18
MYAQIIDDVQQVTLVSCSTLDVEVKGDKKAQAQAVGIELAKRAKSKGIAHAKFDRGHFLYHGRVKALAEGLREGGMEI